MLDEKSTENWKTFIELSGLPDINRDRLYKVGMQSWRTGQNIGKIKITEIREFTGEYYVTCIDGTTDLRYNNNMIYIDLIRVQLWEYGRYFDIKFKKSKKNRKYTLDLQNKLKNS